MHQHKFIYDMLVDAGLEDAKPLSLPVDITVKLSDKEGILLDDPDVYMKFIGKLLYLTVSRSDISYIVNHLSGLCLMLGSSLVIWHSKKQKLVSRSTAEAELRAMTDTICEISWMQMLLSELQVPLTSPVLIHCDNQPALDIAADPVFHPKTNILLLIVILSGSKCNYSLFILCLCLVQLNLLISLLKDCADRVICLFSRD